jgi:hypothetical protein
VRAELDMGMRKGCFSQVYIDGVLQNPGSPTVPFDLASLSPDRIEAIEYHSGPATTPVRYSALTSACGVLAIWLRRTRCARRRAARPGQRPCEPGWRVQTTIVPHRGPVALDCMKAEGTELKLE